MRFRQAATRQKHWSTPSALAACVIITIEAIAKVAFVVRVEAGGIRASAMAWWHSCHWKTAHERRKQRLRAEARTASRLLCAFQEVQGHRGGQLSKLGNGAASRFGWHGECPHPDGRTARCPTVSRRSEFPSASWSRLSTYPFRRRPKLPRTVCAKSAPAVARTWRMAKRVAPTPAVTNAEPDPVSENVAPSLTGTYAAPAPVIEYVSSLPLQLLLLGSILFPPEINSNDFGRFWH